MATLTRSGATGYSTANWKSFDVWGGERASTGSGSLFGYCGNLGHPTDPENGLIYMRARFYEPWTGRFLSEDPARDGLNWYAYGANAPTALVDVSGKAATRENWDLFNLAIAFLTWTGLGLLPENTAVYWSQVSFIAGWIGLREGGLDNELNFRGAAILGIFVQTISILVSGGALIELAKTQAASNSRLAKLNMIMSFYGEYAAFLTFFMALESFLQDRGL